jgi:hypothetical protein
VEQAEKKSAWAWAFWGARGQSTGLGVCALKPGWLRVCRVGQVDGCEAVMLWLAGLRLEWVVMVLRGNVTVMA